MKRLIAAPGARPTTATRMASAEGSANDEGGDASDNAAQCAGAVYVAR